MERNCFWFSESALPDQSSGIRRLQNAAESYGVRAAAARAAPVTPVPGRGSPPGCKADSLPTSTARRATPRFQERCTETLLSVLDLKLAHDTQKPTDYETYSKALPRAYSYVKLHLYETLGLSIIYPFVT